MIRIKRGLDLPISGAPEQKIGDCQAVRSVALLGRDYVGMQPTMAVKAGDRVKLGQVLFTDKKYPAINYTAPGTGIVAAIHRGLQRRLLAVVIELDGAQPDAAQADTHVVFNKYSDKQVTALTRATLVKDLLSSGMWTALRTRPFSKVPNPEATPHSLFVNAMDPAPIIAAQLQDFVVGVNLLARLPRYRLHLCVAPALAVQLKDQAFNGNVLIQQFKGPHPAGLSLSLIHI